jgi:hypothetical protein
MQTQWPDFLTLLYAIGDITDRGRKYQKPGPGGSRLCFIPSSRLESYNHNYQKVELHQV